MIAKFQEIKSTSVVPVLLVVNERGGNSILSHDRRESTDSSNSITVWLKAKCNRYFQNYQVADPMVRVAV